MKEKSLTVETILGSWGGVMFSVTYKMFAEMRKKQSRVVTHIYVGVRDLFCSTHSRPEGQI